MTLEWLSCGPDPRPCHYVYWGWASSAGIEVLAIVPNVFFCLPVTQCIFEYLIPNSRILLDGKWSTF